MSNSLFSLVEQSKNILSIIIENGGELTPEIEAALAEIDVKVPAKIDGYAVTLERLKLETEYWSAKAEQFAKVARACKKLQERLKDNLKNAAAELKTDELKGIDHRFKISNGRPKLVVNEADLDPSYFTQVVVTEVDSLKIEDALTAGLTVKGAHYEVSKSLRTYVNKGGE